MHSKTAFISFFLALTLLVSPAAAVTFLRVDAQTNITAATNATNSTIPTDGPIEVPPLVPPPTNDTLPPIVVENITEVPPATPVITDNATVPGVEFKPNVTIVSSNSLIGFDQFTGLNTLDVFGIAFNEGPADSSNTTLMTALFDFNGTIIAANTSTTFPSTILANQSIPIDVHFDDLDIVGGVFNAAFYQQQADNGTIFFGVFPLPPLPPAPPPAPIDGTGVIVPGPGGGGVPPAPPVEVEPPAPVPVPASLQECLDSYPQNQDICTIGGEIDCNILIAAGVFDFPVVQGSVDPFALDADGDGIGCELFALPSPSGGPAPPAPIEEAPVQPPPANGDQVPPTNVTSPELPGGGNESQIGIPPELIAPPGTNVTNMTAPAPVTNATGEPILNATEPIEQDQEPSEVNNTLAASEEPPTEEDQQQAEESQDDQPEEDEEQQDNGNDDNN